jgi:hypothetical protein
MAWNAQGKWTPEDDSVTTKLNGLLASDSPYIAQARRAGVRDAGKRGLLNSSIAAGSAENAAIAAAAPIASQEASQTAQKNQATLEGNINYDNSSRIQEQQDTSALTRQREQNTANLGLQTTQDQAAMDRLREQNSGNLTLQQISDQNARTRGLDQISANDRQALLAADVNIATQRMATNSQIVSNYLSALGQLTSNEKVPADARNAVIAEFQRVSQASQTYANTISNITLTWGG